MIELAIVVVIIGIIGAIAVPRMGGFVERSREKRLVLDIGRLQSACDMYAEEHAGQNPAIEPGGSAGDASAFELRMLGRTDADGSLNASGVFGPYLQGIPNNSVSGNTGIRIDGAPAGANTHAWRYDSTSGIIEPDHDGDIVTDSGEINLDVVDGMNVQAGGNLGGGGKLGGKLGG